jgi:hypothetical protein
MGEPAPTNAPIRMDGAPMDFIFFILVLTNLVSTG